ncbi:uncharacterized protein LOC106672859 isoform X2 [Cimex lectularius]|nr:uncharacterized protein LOC106672859 isoform X2 [Cimex lectularius]XP_024080327.1 uncharacterized protein LOC106672859 isoform X2 [Cimex lectularius]
MERKKEKVVQEEANNSEQAVSLDLDSLICPDSKTDEEMPCVSSPSQEPYSNNFFRRRQPRNNSSMLFYSGRQPSSARMNQRDWQYFLSRRFATLQRYGFRNQGFHYGNIPNVRKRLQRKTKKNNKYKRRWNSSSCNSCGSFIPSQRPPSRNSLRRSTSMNSVASFKSDCSFRSNRSRASNNSWKSTHNGALTSERKPLLDPGLQSEIRHIQAAAVVAKINSSTQLNDIPEECIPDPQHTFVSISARFGLYYK